MKRSYESPQMKWVPIRSGRAVADVCWAFANNNKPFYYNTYGYGYAELYAVGSKCTTDAVFEIRYMPDDMSAQDKAAADEDMQRVIAQVKAELAGQNKVTNYKGSPFVANPDPDWSGV